MWADPLSPERRRRGGAQQHVGDPQWQEAGANLVRDPCQTWAHESVRKGSIIKVPVIVRRLYLSNPRGTFKSKRDSITKGIWMAGKSLFGSTIMMGSLWWYDWTELGNRCYFGRIFIKDDLLIEFSSVSTRDLALSSGFRLWGPSW